LNRADIRGPGKDDEEFEDRQNEGRCEPSWIWMVPHVTANNDSLPDGAIASTADGLNDDVCIDVTATSSAELSLDVQEERSAKKSKVQPVWKARQPRSISHVHASPDAPYKVYASTGHLPPRITGGSLREVIGPKKLNDNSTNVTKLDIRCDDTVCSISSLPPICLQLKTGPFTVMVAHMFLLKLAHHIFNISITEKIVAFRIVMLRSGSVRFLRVFC
jgi:hypothetical protein